MKKNGSRARLALGVAALLVATAGHAQPGTAPEQRADATLRQMQPAEKTVLTHGTMAMGGDFFGVKLPDGAVPGAGFVPGIPRLGVPSLRESDASLGVAWVMGMRKDGATALPSGLAQAATWNPGLLREGGAMIGAEARAKGFNVLLAGGANLMRDPRNGRTFEYLSEDPLLTGTLVGAAISGIQSNHILSTIKHFAINDQETGRNFIDSRIAEAAARESDLLAFQIGIEQGQPGSVMCAYNRVNGAHACDSDWLLNTVLKRDWRFKGFVMSDWGAVPALSAAANGLDQQSGAQLDRQVFFGKPLADAAAGDKALAARLDDMNRRVLTAIYAGGLDSNAATPGGTIDFDAHGAVALEVAKQGIVLLKNTGGVLPLAKAAKSIAVIGGHADSGVLSGGGSSQVDGEGGPALAIPNGGEGPMAMFNQQHYHRSAPLAAIKAQVPGATVSYRDGQYISEAVQAAAKADVAIVFATAWRTEGMDAPDLSLPNGQDALIAAITAANPHTIVVLETGGPVAMPWLDKAAAVLEAWYPGAKGGEAIASVLFGETNPSGRLPVTFPASLADLPRPKLDGQGEIEASMMAAPPKGVTLAANYDIEGSDVGYRWNARAGHKALFAFGHGLGYTTFASDGLKVLGLSARFTVRNTGARAGDTVAQLYLVSRNGAAKQRLVGYQRVSLAPGETRQVALAIDPRLLADWRDGGWSLAGGAYGFALGDSAEALGPVAIAREPARKWRD
ncbi:MAG: glycoside hydrolase family 3 C-terminal domain-containing protein [Sphingomonadales bacterium]|nr:glycoside hydrolase family 3 C-terminal domain-containing protein [Sphingomonadales bacterium]